LKKVIYLSLTVVLLLVLITAGCDITQLTGKTESGNNVLNLAGTDPTTLDPAVSTETTSAQYIMEIFSGLLRLNDKMQPSPDIASAMPEVSSDGLTYTFKLRPDAKFSNSRPVTAADFLYSWERAADPSTNSQTASSYLGDIVGVKDKLSGRASQISGVKVIDDYNLQVTIDSPKSYFLYKLTYPTTFVLDKNNVNSGADWWHNPNGTGPFKLSGWVQNQSLTLTQNDSYYGSKPQISQIKYQFYSGLPMDLYETGKIDATNVSTEYKDTVTDQSTSYYKELSVYPTLGIYYIGFNCNQSPFDDVNVRKAFSLAVDKDKLISLVLKDMEKKANGVLPPGMPGYNSTLTGLGYDVNQARELIKSSKYGDVSKLPAITLTTAGYGGIVNSILQSLVYQWKENLGVDVNIRQLEPERYYYNTKSEIDQMFEMGWSADYPHPQDFLELLFQTDSSYNYGNYSNSEVDSLIARADRTLDQTTSFTLYQQAEQKIVDDAACIPISFSENYVLTKPYVKGYAVNALGFATLDQVSILPH
jgi:oligopeptide transport system substrate-binding protein